MPYAKINAKWIEDINVRPKTIKFLEKSIREKLPNIGFLGYDSKKKHRQLKQKYIIKLINFCTSKDTINRVKRGSFANHVNPQIVSLLRG